MPWNENGSNRGPWGQTPRSGGGGGGGNQPPDLEELLRQGQQRLKNALPNGGMGGRALGFGGLILLGLWVLTGFYTVAPAEQGLVLRFGEYVRTTPPGFHVHLPYPIETVIKPKVTTSNEIEIGGRSASRSSQRGAAPSASESLMLTGDENIVDINFKVFWQIDLREPPEGELPGPAKYLFNIDNAENAVRAVAEASMREVVGRNDLEAIITRGRDIVQDETRQLMQEALDAYGAGVFITEVNLEKADPPEAVIEAFKDVVNAAQDKNRAINEANAYSNRKLPEARGEAQRILEGARGYAARVVAESRGQAARFTNIYDEYRKAPQVTRERMYLETMERVLKNSQKVVIDSDAGEGVVPYLPLNELNKSSAAPRGRVE
ncbi:MAG: FtsH protease activity modulator HflK [Pseudomonadota bacterium]